MIRKIIVLITVVAAGLLSSCVNSQMGIRNARTYVELHTEDMQLSERLIGEATEVRILGIDFSRLLKKENGNFNPNGYAVSEGGVPILGSIAKDPTKVQNYALYNLLSQNQDYDFVMYPRFEQKAKSILFFYKKTETKVSARLGKLK